jgi:hypothetical protein
MSEAAEDAAEKAALQQREDSLLNYEKLPVLREFRPAGGSGCNLLHFGSGIEEDQ